MSVPSVRVLINVTFQQKARLHIADVTLRNLEEANSLACAITRLITNENVWDITRRRVGSLHHPPTTLIQLSDVIETAWNEIARMQLTISSVMPETTAECINLHTLSSFSTYFFYQT